MKSLSLLMKPASSLCNMRCKYCFYEDVSDLREVKSYGKMTRETAEAIIERAVDYADQISFMFQGGEPTLAGLPFFEYFVEYVAAYQKKTGRHVAVSYGIQTNGTMLDEAFCAFLKKHHFLVGLSVDGNAAFHDENRLDAAGKGTFARVWHSKVLLDQYGVDYNIVSVLTNHHARYPQKLWNFIVKENIRYIQFIPCLGPLEGTPSPYALTPERFCQFYTTLFGLWTKELFAGNYYSVKFFDDLFNLILRHEVTACGFTGKCQMQFVTEADGSVYPCDFYVLDEWRCGSFQENTVEELRDSMVGKNFVCRDHHIPELCSRCPWKNFCGTGCMRERTSMYVNAAGTYCGYGDFLTRNQQLINRTASFLARTMR